MKEKPQGLSAAVTHFVSLRELRAAREAARAGQIQPVVTKTVAPSSMITLAKTKSGSSRTRFVTMNELRETRKIAARLRAGKS
jgi:hypothetical protein